MFPTFELVKELAKKQGLSLNDLEDKIGFSRNSLYSWKKSAPKPEKLNIIADYFNVSTDYLLGRTDNPKIADNQFEWQGSPVNVEDMASNVMMFGGRELTDEKKKIIQSIIEGYLREAGD